MARLTLGLDLGAASIGWALIDESAGTINAAGVRVFPEGVDRDTKGAEVPKMQQRRAARAMRRQIARRARRKRKLRELLVRAGLLPACAAEPPGAPARVEWERDQFKRADPYSLRARARREPLELHDFGRLLVHLDQRRGFKSNRKTDRARRKENSEMLAEISALAQELGNQTLGEYLHSLRGRDPRRFHLVRLRGRHTRRDMYEQEFDAVWAAQQPHHPDVLTNTLRDQVRDIIFFQRPLLPPSPGVVGQCELEPRLPRCPRADRRAQRFRMYQEVNNLRVIDFTSPGERPLSPEERRTVIDLLRTKKERTFDELRKKLFKQYEGVRFNLERGERKKLKGMSTDAALAHKDLLGKAWHRLDEELKDRIVAAIIDDEEPRLRYLLSEAGLDAELAPRLLENLDLDEGYSSYSLHAIKKLLPHIEQGLPLTSRDAQTPCALRAAGYLMPWEHAIEQKTLLGDPPPVTNPLVRQALYEVKKVVNAILRELVYRPGHALGRIQIELAREVRGTAEQRRQYVREIAERRESRAAAAERIRENGAKPTRDAIERYLLWKEQDERCLYSGSSISLRQLLEGEAQIDHILPYSRSLDDSLMNKAVVFRNENDQKGDRTVSEWLRNDPAKYDQILQRARRLPVAKLRRIQAADVTLDDFFARQYVDTAYITTKVHEYVRGLAPDVVCVKGQHTAELRRHWGLNTILSELADSPAWQTASDLPPGEKDRSDHRHHAIDAIVIALTDRARLQQLAALRRAGGTERTGEILPEPWAGFRASVRETVRSLNVSHRVRRRVSGALHEDTIYGPTKTPGQFVYRKPLDTLTPPMIDDIRDAGVRRIVQAHLERHKVDLTTVDKIPGEVWKEPPRMPSGVPVRRVRLLRQDATIRPIRRGTACVKPGRTHHVCLFEWTDEQGRRQRDAVFVTLLEALERIRARQPIVHRCHPTRPGARFLMSLSGGEVVMIQHKGQSGLYRFETGSATTKQMWFRHITFAGKSSDKRGRISKNPNTFDGAKVTIDPLGRVRRAND